MKRPHTSEAPGYWQLTYHILVMDDNGQLLDLVSKMLSSPGYSRVLRRNGMEGIHEFRTHPADLVITDFDMPIMNGEDLG